MGFTDFAEELQKRILVLDGATGTAIQKYNLTDEDFLGKKGCNEILNITRPDIIKEIHLKYMKAGADIVETNSFNCNKISMGDYELTDKVYELSKISSVPIRAAFAFIPSKIVSIRIISAPPSIKPFICSL